MKVKFTHGRTTLGSKEKETDIWDTNTIFFIPKKDTRIFHKDSKLMLLELSGTKKAKTFLKELYGILSAFEAVETFEESIDLLWQFGNKGKPFPIAPYQIELLVALRADTESDSFDLNSSEDIEKYETLVEALKDAMVKFKEENSEHPRI